MATDYFLLEVYAHDLQFDAALGPVVQQDDPRTSFALAFQFLDYPLLLTYAQSGPSFGSASVIRFSAGKSCVLQEEADELQYVLQKARQLVLVHKTMTWHASPPGDPVSLVHPLPNSHAFVHAPPNPHVMALMHEPMHYGRRCRCTPHSSTSKRCRDQHSSPLAAPQSSCQSPSHSNRGVMPLVGPQQHPPEAPLAPGWPTQCSGRSRW